MAQKTVWLDDIGEIVLAKRRGTKNLRLSITAAGKVRVGLPAWAPYAAGISFAKSRAEWIIKHQAGHRPRLLADGGRIGKSTRLRYIYDPAASRTSTRRLGQELRVSSRHSLAEPSVQAAARRAAERVLKQEAESLLTARLAQLAAAHKFNFKSVQIKKLTSRWGSCSSDKVITLNYFLMQLPWQLIDYVLIHELVHTRHLNHSPAFWLEFESAYPKAKATRQQIKSYRPVINSIS